MNTIIICCLLEVLMVTTVQPSENAAISGYGLFRSDSKDWAWSPVALDALVAAQSFDSGECKLVFSVPESALSGLDLRKARVGIVTGAIGTHPRMWISPDKPYIADANVQSPWATNLMAQAVLQKAIVKRENGRLGIALSLDTAPDLRSAWDLYLLIDADGDPNSGYQGANYLIQNTTLARDDGGKIVLPWFEIRPGILKPGEEAEVTAWIQNTTAQPLDDVKVRLMLPGGLLVRSGSTNRSIQLRQKEAKRLTWKVAADKAGQFLLRIQADSDDSCARGAQWMSAVIKRDPKREFQTESGAWLSFPPRLTLQSGNKAPVKQLKSLPSSQLKHNLFGITAHLPRSTNEEDPFIVSHAVDGDPSTCWASRWWRTAIPFSPEWIEIDLGKVKQASEVRILPAWKNSGFPAAFTISLSKDGRHWETAVDETDYQLQQAPDGDPLRSGELTWQRYKIEDQPVRYVRLEATRLNQGGTSFFCAPFEPFQFRIAEIVVIDNEGKPVDAAGKHASVSSTHTAWYNSPETIKKSWPLLLNSGVKLNRIGQWGDKIDWATVEKAKGVYKVDPEVDKCITESVNAGIEILMTLDYGNNIYQQLKDAPDFGPTWHRGHPFLQCAPTTPEAIEGFANYCAFMATHFRGRVKYFEIWNEENGWFFDAWADNGKVSMVKAYGRALAAAAKAIKQANPDAVVMFGGTAGSTLDFPQIALEEGAGPYIDAFAFHPYGHPTPEAAPSHFLTEVDGKMDWKPRPPEITDYEEEIAAFRRLLHKYNPKIQILANEMNWFAPGEPSTAKMGDQSELTQAKHLARFYAINAWLGCGAVWWSLYNSNGIQEWAVLRSYDLTPRAAYYSAGYVSTVLDDVRGIADFKVKVVGDAPKDLMVKAYRNGRGETFVGLWRTCAGNDECQPASVSLRLPGMKESSIELIDTLYGYRQKAVTHSDGDGLVVPDVLAGDWPVILQIVREQ